MKRNKEILYAWSDFYRKNTRFYGVKSQPRTEGSKTPDDYYSREFEIKHKEYLQVQEQIRNFDKLN